MGIAQEIERSAISLRHQERIFRINTALCPPFLSRGLFDSVRSIRTEGPAVHIITKSFAFIVLIPCITSIEVTGVGNKLPLAASFLLKSLPRNAEL